MYDIVTEEFVRKNAIFFAKGKMPEIVSHRIPDTIYDKKKTYIVAIIEADPDEFEPEIELPESTSYTYPNDIKDKDKVLGKVGSELLDLDEDEEEDENEL